MRNPVISFQHVSKYFLVNRQEKLKNKLNFFSSKPEAFTALKDISFNIFDKEAVGFYGPNGSGKSTIMRLIAGILKADSGKVLVSKKVAPVLELGTGLHPELSGLENIFLYGTILNIPKSVVMKSCQQIIAFSGLKSFINTPVKKYSTGMRSRLAFSISIFSDADILLLDETLSVGDLEFREKAINVLKQIKEQKTIIFTSHNFSLMHQVCDRMYHINQGVLDNSSESRFKLFLKELDDNLEIKVEALSGSMSPTIKKGDSVVIKKIPFNRLKVNDIVAFTFSNISEIVIHRIISKNHFPGNSFLTKGDISLESDPWILTIEDYLGKVVRVETV